MHPPHSSLYNKGEDSAIQPDPPHFSLAYNARITIHQLVLLDLGLLSRELTGGGNRASQPTERHGRGMAHTTDRSAASPDAMSIGWLNLEYQGSRIPLAAYARW